MTFDLNIIKKYYENLPKKIDEFKQIYSYDSRVMTAGKSAKISGKKGEKNLKLTHQYFIVELNVF